MIPLQSKWNCCVRNRSCRHLIPWNCCVPCTWRAACSTHLWSFLLSLLPFPLTAFPLFSFLFALALGLPAFPLFSFPIAFGTAPFTVPFALPLPFATVPQVKAALALAAPVARRRRLPSERPLPLSQNAYGAKYAMPSAGEMTVRFLNHCTRAAVPTSAHDKS